MFFLVFVISSSFHGSVPDRARFCATRLGEPTVKQPTMVNAPFLARLMRTLEKLLSPFHPKCNPKPSSLLLLAFAPFVANNCNLLFHETEETWMK